MGTTIRLGEAGDASNIGIYGYFPVFRRPHGDFSTLICLTWIIIDSIEQTWVNCLAGIGNDLLARRAKNRRDLEVDAEIQNCVEQSRVPVLEVRIHPSLAGALQLRIAVQLLT